MKLVNWYFRRELRYYYIPEEFSHLFYGSAFKYGKNAGPGLKILTY